MRTRIAIAAFAVLASCLPALAASHAKPIPLADVSHVHGIGFAATAPGSIFLATHSGLFRANPDGTAVAISHDRNDYMGFTPHPVDASRLLGSGHAEGGGNMGVIVSEDAGATWTQLSAGAEGPVDFHAMTVSRADPMTVYGLFGGIQSSRDGGTNWSIVGPGPERVIDLAASPTQPEVLYAATVPGLMLSSDAGKTWQLIGPANVAATMVETTADSSIYAFFAGAGLFRLSSADGKWAALASGFGETYIVHLAADASDSAHLVAVTNVGAIIESTDGGKTWEPFGP